MKAYILKLIFDVAIGLLAGGCFAAVIFVATLFVIAATDFARAKAEKEDQ